MNRGGIGQGSDMANEATDVSATAHITLIGNFLPRQCGIATFTTDTYAALRSRFPDLRVDVYAMDDHPGRHSYPAAVTGTIAQHDLSAYLATARAIEASGSEAIWLQHEYGIFGGDAGDHILALLDRTTLPLVVTLHTVLERPSAEERRVLEALLRRAARVIVMAERGREILTRVYGANPKTIATIPHGVPDRVLADPALFKPRFGWEGRKVVLTFGLLAPNKGIETMIRAMPAIVSRVPEAHYVVLGATHPNLIAYEGEAYRDRLKTLARDLDVADHVSFIDAFVDHDDLIDYLQAADVYATPYSNPAQITSGTLSYAVGVGKPVVSTPYVHATEILDDGHGVLVDFDDSAGFAIAIGDLLANDAARRRLAVRAYARGRTMIWSRSAEAAMIQIAAAIAARPSRIAVPERSMAPLAPDLRAVIRMSDSTGMLQHAIFAIPDRRHGYCIDDNARALILMSAAEGIDPVERERWASIYAAFLQYAWNPERRRFRNFMAFDRQWCEDVGSEDSNGRTLWALGVTARDADSRRLREWAIALFDTSASLAFELGSPRARAFAILGAVAILEAHPAHKLASAILKRFPDELVMLLDTWRQPGWTWFESVLAYDNARLPEALLRAGHALGRADLVARGIETLAWLADQQTAPAGHFRAVGSESFGRPYAPPLPFDQQPLEAQATVEACEAAFRATGDRRWLDEAERAYRWFLGANDLDLPLADDAGACFDGLCPTGLNRNQGAESILALQLASCVISGLSKRAGKVAGPGSAVA